MGGTGTGYHRTTFDQQAWERAQFEERQVAKPKGHSAGCACTTCAKARKEDDNGKPDNPDAKHS